MNESTTTTRQALHFALAELIRCCPVAAGALAVSTIATAILPVVMLVAMGAVISALPSAAQAGPGVPVGRDLVVALVASGVSLAAMLAMSPVRDAASAVVRSRLTAALQRRLMQAVSAPVGVAHLEDPVLLDRLQLAQGTVATSFPAETPITLASITASKVTGIAACIVLASVRWWAGALPLAYWSLSYWSSRRTLIAQSREFHLTSEGLRQANYQHMLTVSPAAAKEVRLFGLGEWLIDRYRSLYLDTMSIWWGQFDRQSARTASIAIGAGMLYAVTLVAIADAAVRGQLGFGAVATLVPMVGLTTQLGTVEQSDITLAWSTTAMAQVMETEQLLRQPRQTFAGDASPPDGLRESIRFEDVSFSYAGASSCVFGGLDLELRAGRSTAIVGANGAGKSTLVKLLARLYDPDGGRITADGRDIRDLRPEEWRSKLAVVFQDFTRYPLALDINVGLGAPSHCADADAIVRSLEEAGAADLLATLPHGAASVLSRDFTGGVELSGGQWQRVALARALFATKHGAEVLVLDEPTAWLDARAEAEFYEHFLELTRGRTTVVISHRMSTVRQADHIYVIERGAVIESGDHDSLVRAGGRYAAAFALQAAAFDADPATSGSTR